MSDSVAENLPTSPKAQEIFPNYLPSELFKFIFSHSDVVTLVHLSATSRILRLQVHNFFTSRLSDQAKKYPEIRDSLSRLGWTKKHDHSTCDCFKLVAGPGFTWRQLTERKFFSTVDTSADSATACTTVAGRTFFLTSDKEVIFFQNSTEDNMMPQNPRSLVSFKSSPIEIGPLSSYDQVLAFSLKEPAPNGRHAICLYSPNTLSKTAEIDLIAYDSNIPEDIRNLEVASIAFAKDSMAISLRGNVRGYCTNILIFKINTNEPQEEGIGLVPFLGTIAAPPMNLHEHYAHNLRTIGINDRFIAILLDYRVEVFNRQNGVARRIGRGGASCAAWALEKEEGDHIAFAFTFYPKLVFQISSVTQGHIIIQKEVVVEWPFTSVRYMKWFGPHLVIILEKDNVLSMMSWQPGRTSFLSCPLNVPVVRRSSRFGGGEGGAPEWDGGGEPEWVADCVHVDYGGISIALKNEILDSKNHIWRYE